MQFIDTPVSFSIYYVLNFYSDFLKIIYSKKLPDAQVELIQKVIYKLVNYDDVMLPVEKIASVHSATELTIFLADLIERSMIIGPFQLLEKSVDLANDFAELFVLVIEEEGFIEELTEFVSDVEEDSKFISEEKAQYYGDAKSKEKKEILVAEYASHHRKKKEKNKLEIKEKLHSYFLSEVGDHLQLASDIIDVIKIHKFELNKFRKLLECFTSLRNLSVVHGYNGLEFISNELRVLLEEAIQDNLVFTSSAADELRLIVSDSEKLAMLCEIVEEQKWVDALVDRLNTFNSSLAILDTSEKILLTIESEQVKAELKKLSSKKINLFTVSIEAFKKLRDDYILIHDTIHYEFSLRLLNLSSKQIEKKKNEIEFLLTHDVLPEDIQSFFAELSGTSNLIETDLFEEGKVSEDISKSKVGIEQSSKFEDEKQFTFSEIMKELTVYPEILSKKLLNLKTYFENNDEEGIIVLSNALEYENRWLSYTEISDFFDFFSLNLDFYLKSKFEKEKLFTEFALISENPVDYKFDVESFVNLTSEKEIEEKTDDNSIEKNDGQTENWIGGVADVLENISTTQGTTTIKIGIKAIFENMDPEIRDIYIDEASSYISTINNQLDILSKNKNNHDAINLAEKAARTLKSASMLLNIPTIEKISEKVEEILTGIKIYELSDEELRFTEMRHLISIIDNLLNDDVEAARKLLTELDVDVDLSSDDLDVYDSELLEIFQEESAENLEQIERALRQVFSDMSDTTPFAKIETNALSLKSAAKMLGFERVGLLAESIEDHSNKIIKEKIQATQKILNAFIAVLDQIKELNLGRSVNTDNYNDLLQNLVDSFKKGKINSTKGDTENDEELIHDLFFSEFVETITSLSKNLYILKRDGIDKGILKSISFLFFQLKSSSLTLQFLNIANLSDLGENIAAALYQKKDMDVVACIRNLSAFVIELVKALKYIKENNSDDIVSLKSLILKSSSLEIFCS